MISSVPAIERHRFIGHYENLKSLEEINDVYRRDGTAARIIAEERAQRAEGGERARGREEGGTHGAQSAIS